MDKYCDKDDITNWLKEGKHIFLENSRVATDSEELKEEELFFVSGTSEINNNIDRITLTQIDSGEIENILNYLDENSLITKKELELKYNVTKEKDHSINALIAKKYIKEVGDKYQIIKRR